MATICVGNSGFFTASAAGVPRRGVVSLAALVASTATDALESLLCRRTLGKTKRRRTEGALVGEGFLAGAVFRDLTIVFRTDLRFSIVLMNQA